MPLLGCREAGRALYEQPNPKKYRQPDRAFFEKLDGVKDISLSRRIRYNLRKFDFVDYEPLTEESLFGDYKRLLPVLYEHDELRFLETKRDASGGKEGYETYKYYERYHKGYPVEGKGLSMIIGVDDNKVLLFGFGEVDSMDVDTQVVISPQVAYASVKRAGEAKGWEMYEKYSNSKLVIGLNKLWYRIEYGVTNPYDSRTAWVNPVTSKVAYDVSNRLQ